MSAAARRAPAADRGSAVLEFVVLATLLMVPLAYLVLVLGRLQAGAFAVQAAAASAVRVATSSTTSVQAADGSRAAVALALADQGFGATTATTSTTCSVTPCLQPGARLQVTVRVDVELPGVPALLRAVVPAHVGVESTAVGVVDRFAPQQVAGGAP